MENLAHLAPKPPSAAHDLGSSAPQLNSLGLNIVPGHEDDGWISPDPVTLADGSLVQLYKDGEGLHAAFEAIKNAKRRICLEMYIFSSDETGRAFAELLC